jgi:hypothetical protein
MRRTIGDSPCSSEIRIHNNRGQTPITIGITIGDRPLLTIGDINNGDRPLLFVTIGDRPLLFGNVGGVNNRGQTPVEQ